MFSSKELILEHTLALEFNYKYEGLYRYELYDFELCWFLNINMKPLFTKILLICEKLIELLEDPSNLKLRKKYLQVNEIKTKYIRKNELLFIFPISLPDFGEPLIEMCPYVFEEQAGLQSHFFGKGVPDLSKASQVFLRKTIFQLEYIKKLFGYENPKLEKLKRYYTKKYNEPTNEIINKVLYEINKDQLHYSSFFIIYLYQMGVLKKEDIPKNHYFYDEELKYYE